MGLPPRQLRSAIVSMENKQLRAKTGHFNTKISKARPSVSLPSWAKPTYYFSTTDQKNKFPRFHGSPAVQSNVRAAGLVETPMIRNGNQEDGLQRQKEKKREIEANTLRYLFLSI